MASEQFDIVFRGDIVLGHNLADVKRNLQQLFKADAAKIDALFSGKPTPLKRGLDAATAQKYRDVLLKAGAQVSLVAAVAQDAIVESSPAIAPKTSPQTGHESNTSEFPKPSAPEKIIATKSLAERLAEQAEAEAQALELKVQQEAQRQAQRDAEYAAASQRGEFSLAPVGVDLLASSEKAPEVVVSVDVSHLSLREASGNLLDASEVEHQPEVFVPDLNVSLAPVGELLILDSEKNTLPLPEIDVADWDIADLGSVMIDPNELPQPQVQPISELNVGLAPVGTDLGQIKKTVTPVVPDTSKLALQ